MNYRNLVLAALFLSMSIIGANIKILGSIAFDSFPAFFATLLLGPFIGGGIAIAGHMASALLAGFPLGLPIHFLIAFLMGITMIAFYYAYQWNGKGISAHMVAFLVGLFCNVGLSVLAVYPFLGADVFGIIIPLTIATVCNIALAQVLYAYMPIVVRMHSVGEKISK